jgi:two-component system, LytTR family, sensor kinase
MGASVRTFDTLKSGIMKLKYLSYNGMVLTDSKKTWITMFIHVFIWVALFSLPLLFRPQINNAGGIPVPFHIPTPIWMNNIFMVIAFYINLLILMPQFFNKKRWGYYLFFTCLFLAASFFIHLLAQKVEQWGTPNIISNIQGGHGPEGMRPPWEKGIPNEMRERHGGFEFRQFSFIYMFTMTWALSMAYFLFVKLQESVRKADQVVATALQSELSFLKAQINPHFLFNTLNNIYVLTLKKSERAPEAVMKLSNLMRKITTDTDVDLVSFSSEEEFIRDYIELQELRLTAKTKVTYQLSGEYHHLRIAPRILIPFIDNAFKYGVSNRNESEILIRFEFSDHHLYFTIKNAKHPNSGESLESSGVGLGNSRRRLDLLYKNRYELNINETEEDYQVLLTLELTK